MEYNIFGVLNISALLGCIVLAPILSIFCVSFYSKQNIVIQNVELQD